MKNARRHFLKTIGLSGLALSLPYTQLLAENDTHSDIVGFVTNAESNETYYIAGRQAPVTIVIDKKKKDVSSMSLCFEDIKSGDSIPVHKHMNETEIIYIQSGTGIFTLNDKEFPVKEGSSAYIPIGVWHGLENNGNETLRMLFGYTPSGFESYFREIGVPKGTEWITKTPEEFESINKKYGIIYKH